jgi:hypothetical protein
MTGVPQLKQNWHVYSVEGADARHQSGAIGQNPDLKQALSDNRFSFRHRGGIC